MGVDATLGEERVGGCVDESGIVVAVVVTLVDATADEGDERDVV